MKRSDMIKKLIVPLFNYRMEDRDTSDEEVADELLYILEHNGMLPPTNTLGLGEWQSPEEECTWEPEEENEV